MSAAIVAARLVGAQQHNPPAAHIVLLAAVVAIGLIAFGAIRWRQRRARVEQDASARDRVEENERSGSRSDRK